MNLNSIVLKRLSFIKYLYQLAVEQSNQPSPKDSASILTFHDSIELFLQLSGEILNAKIKTTTKFMEYWEIINKELGGVELSQKASMNRLNTARRSLKHNGLLPIKPDIESFRVNSKDFFEENTPIVFGIEFSEISLIDLIQNDKVKKILTDIQDLCKNGQYKDALEHSAIAFDVLISDYEKSKTDHFGRSPFLVGEDIRWIKPFDVNSNLEGIFDSLEEIQKAIKLLCFNINYRKYAKFRLLTPKLIFGSKFYDKYNIIWFNEEKSKFKKKTLSLF